MQKPLSFQHGYSSLIIRIKPQQPTSCVSRVLQIYVSLFSSSDREHNTRINKPFGNRPVFINLLTSRGLSKLQ